MISNAIAHNYKVPFILSAYRSKWRWICNNSSSNDPGWLYTSGRSRPCICRYRYFFKSTTAPDCSRDFRPDGEIHLSCRLEDREPGHRRVFLSANRKAEEKAAKTVKSSIQDITEGEEDECEQLMYALILSGLYNADDW